MIHTTRDVGIGLESSPDTRVLNNTVYAENYGNAIEYRWAATRDVVIQGNLTLGAIQLRNDASGTVGDNHTGATAAYFVDYTRGDLHLSSARPEAVDQAPALAEVTEDLDGQARPVGAAPDLGADEWSEASGPPSAPEGLTVN